MEQTRKTAHATPDANRPTRRDFIKTTAAAAAGIAAGSLFRTPVYGQNQAPSTGSVVGANERIAVGVIGVGFGIGKNHLQGIHERAAENNVAIAGACDVFSVRRDWAKEKAGLKDSDLCVDYRKMLERKDIDAVVVATHDPLHMPMCIDALEAGKHLYCEKPLTRYLDEGFKVYDVVKKTGKVFQVGSQGCTAGAWRKAAELIKAGQLGTLVWGQGYYCRNNPKGEWNYTIETASTAENIDWKRWLGPVSDRPFSADTYHRWRKHYAFCSGLLGDLMPHRMHPLMLATGNPEFPRRVVAVGTRNVHTDRNTPGTPEREVPEHVQVIAEFPSGLMLTVTCSSVNARSPGFVLYGHRASLEIADQGNGLQLIPERAFAADFEGLTETERKEQLIEPLRGLQHEDVRAHEKNWFDCIRSGKEPNGNIDLAIRVQSVISLAEMSERLNVACLFDEKTRKITTGDGKALEPITYGSLPLS